jgi:serine/threonine protein kinase
MSEDAGPDYVIEYQLSEEMTSFVYRATQVGRGASVAIKVPKVDCTQTYHEVSILRQVAHPCIINLIDVVDTEAGPAPVYPLAIGDLLSFVPDGGIDEQTVKLIVFRIILALSYLHTNHIWHLDIKPENILVMSHNICDVVLTDFGLAACCPAGVCREPYWPGSLPYSAPELLKCLPYTEKVDMWSLGVTMFALLTGGLPFEFEGKEPLDVIHEELPYVTDRIRLHASDAGRQLLDAMLQESPLARITACQALNHEWFVDVVPLCVAALEC